MIIEFSVKNFRSIKEQQTLSLVKGKGDEMAEMNSFTPDAKSSVPLLHSCAIYGANASGKSNIIKAIDTMRKIVIGSARDTQRGDDLPVEPFLFSEESKNQPTEFEIFFIAKGVRYQYGFSLTQKRIHEEWLFAYPEGRSQCWLSRVFIAETQSYDWKPCPYLKGRKKLWQEATRSNALFLSTAIHLNSEQLRPIYDWFTDFFHVIPNAHVHHGFTASLCKKDEYKQKVMRFLKSADLDIQDFIMESAVLDREKVKFPADIPDALKDKLLEELKDEIVNIKTVHRSDQGQVVYLDMDDESDGTQKLFAFAGPIIDVLENGYVLFVDELHNHLHPKMVFFLVALFHNPKTNPKNAQLIFTTHETSILNQEIFRRDQIWFCEKDDNQCTVLYPLSDFSPRKGAENLERNYLAGRYGALPYIRSLWDI
ncbi:MAG: AAA family ATPase [Methylobacter sp.]|nr:AAA family ATPase [Methylobacter sp.]